MVSVQTRSIRAALVATAGLALASLAPVAAATEVPLLPFPFELRATDDLPGRPVQPVLGELDTLYALEAVALTGLAHPALEDARIELVRVRVATKAAAFFVDGQLAGGSHDELEAGLSLWTGSVAGEPGSEAFFAFSPHGSRGWVHARGELVHLLAGPAQDGDWSQSIGRLVTEAEMQLVDVRPSQYCQLDDLPARTGSRTETRNPVAPLAPRARAGLQPNTSGETLSGTASLLLEARIAVETDFQYYSLFNDLDAARTYALSLFGAVSARYREQTNTVLTLPYLALYTDVNDPWLAQDDPYNNCIDVLYELQSTWNTGMPVEADLGTLLSAANLGCGVAWLDALCQPDIRYSVMGNLGGDTPFPIVQGPLNWDFDVTAHELGHNFSTPHTHDFCPPLDECAPAGYWGACQDEQLCVPGTIMSYCHLCSGGEANKTTYFHPTVVDQMRSRMDDSCLKPFEGIFDTDLENALAGSAGTPTLAASYDLPNHALEFEMENTPAATTGFLVGGSSQVDLAFYGGVLVPSPDFLLPFATTGSTTSYPPLDLSDSSLPFGLTVYFQSWFIDVAAPNFVSASNGIELEVFVPAEPPTLTWVPHPSNGLEYAALTTPATVWKQEALGLQYGGHLVAITSAALESWLDTQFLASGTLSGDIYIGGTDGESEGTFGWTSGAAWSYDNWASGQPNDFNGAQDYTDWRDGIEWTDVEGFDLLPAIAQRPQ